jgi:potassium-transporting ATPase KdpC subunit
MLQQFLPALRMTIFLTILTGLVYPGVVTGVCQMLFSRQANGSLVTEDGRVVGSSLIGQRFNRAEYFHSRPSLAGKEGYDATASGGSNLGPASRELVERVEMDARRFREENPEHEGPIPADAVTASGSGLDPDISLANAMAQASRVAKARGIDEADVLRFIHSATHGRVLGLLGETRVNVLELNLQLDRATHSIRR